MKKTEDAPEQYDLRTELFYLYLFPGFVPEL